MKILVAMSGGVDSSYTAKILQDAGHEIIGCYMKLHNNENAHEANYEKVQKVGKFLGIKTTILDLKQQFNEMVYTPFVELYKQGKTPNPCAMCNRYIKLGELVKFAKSLGCEKVATGHYVRMENGLIKVAKDLSKDQSYFLSNAEKNALDFMMFPLGDMLKKDVKASVAKYPELIAIAEQKESSEICFVEKTYIDILSQHYNTDLKGVVRDSSGKEVGTHKGYMHYTIGKRSGFSVFGAHEPHYVLDIDAQKNEIIVGKKDELQSFEFNTQNFNSFIDDKEFEANIKIRYRSPKVRGVVKVTGNGVCVKLHEAVFGIASSQLAVFYDDNDRVLGSGFIC